MTSSSVHQEEHTAQKDESGLSWRQNEHVIPKNRLGIVSSALVCTMFLAALDNTIVATVVPTIVAHLKGGSNYSWIGNAYILSADAFGPIYGKLSNMFGRKPLLYSSIAVFLLGSALCGAAQNMTWLIVCRALQGIGAGGIMQLSMIVTSDIVPLKDRARYGGLLGATYGIASNVVGPLLGGALAQYASWRWCFLLNLPIGGISVTLLCLFLNIHPPQKHPLRDQIAELDFVGLFSLVVGTVSFLVGLNFGGESWSEPRTIGLLITGLILLVIGVVNEAFTTRTVILPPRLFKDFMCYSDKTTQTRTTGCLLVIGFLQNVVFMAAMFYLPLFYQVLGSSATGAGVKMLPYTFVTSAFTGLAGFVVSKMGRNRPAIWFGSTLFTIGTGLMLMLNYRSNTAEEALFSIVAAIGMAFLFQTPIVALQAAMPHQDMATATGAFMFLRTLGSAVGLSVGEAIISIVLPRRLAAIPNIARLGLGDNINMTVLNDSVFKVHLIPDVVLRNAVMHAWASSIGTVWMVATVWAGVALFLTLFLREYSVDRKTVYSGGATNSREGENTMPTEEQSAETNP